MAVSIGRVRTFHDHFRELTDMPSFLASYNALSMECQDIFQRAVMFGKHFQDPCRDCWVLEHGNLRITLDMLGRIDMPKPEEARNRAAEGFGQF